MPALDPNDRARLMAFEEAIDAAVRDQPLVKLPIRALLALIHYFLFTTLHGTLLAKKPTREIAVTTTSRLGYLLPLFLDMSAEPYGRDAEDAVMSAEEVDPEGQQLRELLAYAHFSQIMPEVWRGYYTLTFESETALRLAHRNAEFAAWEGADILLSELAMPFRFHRERNKPDPDVAALIQTNNSAFGPLLILAVAKKAKVYRHGQAENTPVDDAGMLEIFGFDAGTFRAIQAAMLGLAEVADEAAVFLAVWSLQETKGQDITAETLEWLSVNLRPEIVTRVVAGVSGATEAQVEAFVDAFAIDFRTAPPTHRGGDGFFPPFMRGTGTLLFSPILVMSSLSARNAVYGFAEVQRQAQETAKKSGQPLPQDRFSAFVANVLEPQLLAQTEARLPVGHGWRVLKNVDVPGGEVDLVLIDLEAQFALCLQAKAPLPPQGARMTQRLQDRVREGIAQTDRFVQLSPAAQRAPIEARVGVSLPELRLHHGLLAPACFGAEAWAERDRLVLVTPGVMGLAAKAYVAGAPLERFATQLVEVLDNFIATAMPNWQVETLSVLGRSVTLPLFKYDHGHVEKTRELAWPGDPPPRLDLQDFVRTSEASQETVYAGVENAPPEAGGAEGGDDT